jgi:hypothetical protein
LCPAGRSAQGFSKRARFPPSSRGSREAGRAGPLPAGSGIRLTFTLQGRGTGLDAIRVVNDIQHSQRALPAMKSIVLDLAE